jgi:hypothetical protein
VELAPGLIQEEDAWDSVEGPAYVVEFAHLYKAYVERLGYVNKFKALLAKHGPIFTMMAYV